MSTATVGLSDVAVGERVRFAEEKQAYTVQARSERFLVCTKPFNPRRTSLYTVVDLVEGVRGTENLVFGMGAETREQCEEMVGRLERGTKWRRLNHEGGWDAISAEEKQEMQDGTEVSYRNRIPLHVTAVLPARAS